MANESRFVFIWRDDAKRLAHVFHGDALEPKLRWIERDAYESDLNDWLRGLDSQPALAEGSLRFAVFANVARTAKRRIEKKLAADGWTILSARDRSTLPGGWREERAVYVRTAWGLNWFPSVHRAAAALGVDPSTVTLAAQDPKREDIQYADEIEEVDQQ